MSVWTQRLDAEGLSNAYSRNSRAEIVRSILDGRAREPQAPQVSQSNNSELPYLTSFIEKIEIESFRKYPSQKTFDLKTVNLFIGANGAGKTSLLECIEHFYCGGTKRSECNSTTGFKAKFSFRGLNDPIEFKQQPNRIYQELELRWYGNLVNRKNNLPESFNRFNFFNSDAAVLLANSSKADDAEVDQYFSRLALGEYANFISNRLEELDGDLEKVNASGLLEINRIQEQIALDEKVISDHKAAKPRLDALLSSVKPKVIGLGWKSVPATDDELQSFLQAWFRFAPPFSSLASKPEYSQGLTIQRALLNAEAIDETIQQVKGRESKIKEAEVFLRRQRDDLKSLEDRLKNVERYRAYLDVGFQSLSTNLSSLEREGNSKFLLAAQIQNVSLDSIGLEQELSPIDRLYTEFSDIHKTLSSQKKLVSERLRTTESAASEITKALSEIRFQGSELIKRHPHLSSACPLCSTKFENGMLAQRLESLKASAQSITDISGQLSQLEKLSADLDLVNTRLAGVGTVIDILSKYPSLGISISSSVKELREKFSSFLIESSATKKRLEETRGQIEALSRIGFSQQEFQSVVGAISSEFEMPGSQQVLFPEELDKRIKFLKLDIEKGNQVVHEAIAAQATLKAQQAETLEMSDPALLKLDMATAISTLQQRLEALQSIKRHVSAVEDIVSISPDQDLGEIASKVRDLEALVSQLSQAYEEHLKGSNTFSNLVDRLAGNRALLESEQVKQRRAGHALEVIRDLRTNHGKEKALEEFVRANRDTINLIFGKIHSPREFKGFSNSGLKLLRKGNLGLASLSELSTGQRSAVALSVFFTLNSQLQGAPPAILIDDPVAHIDDLNTLSFLDFLRELAMTGKKQIFFATASHKLASLFRQKFSFLGKEFAEFNLERPAELDSDPR